MPVSFASLDPVLLIQDELRHVWDKGIVGKKFAQGIIQVTFWVAYQKGRGKLQEGEQMVRLRNGQKKSPRIGRGNRGPDEDTSSNLGGERLGMS